jgi:hypothetical protein
LSQAEDIGRHLGPQALICGTQIGQFGALLPTAGMISELLRYAAFMFYTIVQEPELIDRAIVWYRFDFDSELLVEKVAHAINAKRLSGDCGSKSVAQAKQK